MAKKLTAAEIRAAKSWLNRRGIHTKDITPREFAHAAKTLDKKFSETLAIIAGEQTHGVK